MPKPTVGNKRSHGNKNASKTGKSDEKPYKKKQNDISKDYEFGAKKRDKKTSYKDGSKFGSVKFDKKDGKKP
jgi:hypothetical protein